MTTYSQAGSPQKGPRGGVKKRGGARGRGRGRGRGQGRGRGRGRGQGRGRESLAAALVETMEQRQERVKVRMTCFSLLF